MNIYDFSVNGMDGKKVDLSVYSGKVLLIVNTATRCGFTPQYTELEKLYKKYRDRGFEILDFPSNQFREQAPEDIDEIDRICRVDYGTEFPRFGKIEVNGAGENPLYTFLKAAKGFAGFNLSHPLGKKIVSIVKEADPDYEKNSAITWNFTKFLVDRKGNVVRRFEPTASFDDIAKAIEAVL